MSAELEACLPAELRGPDTTIAPIAAGLSGAGVYRVEVAGRAYVLKVAPPHEPLDSWRARASILRAAADAGVAPRVVHVDETRHAVVTEFVADRSFIARFVDPATRAAAIGELGAALRRVHALPIPAVRPGPAQSERAAVHLTLTSTGGDAMPFATSSSDAELASRPRDRNRCGARLVALILL